MILNESVTIYFDDPKSFARYNFLKKYGFEGDDSAAVYKGRFKEGFWTEISLELKRRGLQPEAFHSIYPTFEKSDFERASLLILSLPEYALDVNFRVICPICGSRRFAPIYKTYVNRALPKSNIYYVGVGAVVVSKRLRSMIEHKNLVGISFSPFDDDETYFFLIPLKSLGRTVIHKEECQDFNGNCPECGKARFGMYFGPTRHNVENWHGEDVIIGGSLDIPLFTCAAFELIKSVQSNVKASAPVFLE